MNIEKEREKIQRDLSSFTASMLGRPKVARVNLGTCGFNDRRIWANDDQRAIHMHVLGRSGQGKTYLLESMMRSDIDNGRGLCLIDPHGDLYERILRYCVRKRLDDKVILIDPRDREWAVGLNYLEFDERAHSEVTSHTGMVMKGIAKVFGGEAVEAMPRLQRWERNALVPLVAAQFTLIELGQFLDDEDTGLRYHLIERLGNRYIEREWHKFDRARKFDKDTYVDAVLNRANKFSVGTTIRRIFGQRVSTIDFRKAMDEGKIILCNLNCGISEEEWKMLGVVIIDKMYQAAMSRIDIPESKRKRLPPFYFYIDEFGELVSDDIAKALKDLRKFRVSLVLAHQELEQLREESPKLYSAVMAEPDIRLVFSISREDAEIMEKSMFTGQIRGDKIKRVIEQTKFRPVESTRTTHVSGGGGGSSDGTSLQYDPNLGGLSPTRTETSNYQTNWNETTIEAPFTEYHEFMEVSSIQDYAIEEMHEKFISWIVNQSPRHAQLQIGRRKPIPIVTPEVTDIAVRQKDIEAFKERIYRKYARPVDEVDQEIEERESGYVRVIQSSGVQTQLKPARTEETIETVDEMEESLLR